MSKVLDKLNAVLTEKKAQDFKKIDLIKLKAKAIAIFDKSINDKEGWETPPMVAQDVHDDLEIIVNQLKNYI